MPSERLFRAELPEQQVLWLTEIDAPTAGSLRVFVVVDCSDSNWENIRRDLEPALATWLSCLRGQDRLELWVLGEQAPRRTLTPQDLSGGASATAAQLSKQLALTNRGSWLFPTLPRVFGSELLPDEVPLLLLLTDGEIFDADSNQHVGTPFERCCIFATRDEQAPLRRLPNAAIQRAHKPRIDALFTRPLVSAALRVEWQGTGAFCFDGAQRPSVEPLREWSLVSQREGAFRLALLGGDAPKLSLVCRLGERSWAAPIAARVLSFSGETEPRLGQVSARILGLQGRLRSDLARALRAKAPPSLACGYCSRSFELAQLSRAELTCPSCLSSRITEGIAFEEDANFAATRRAWLQLSAELDQGGP